MEDFFLAIEIYPSFSAKAADLETPHLPFGNSSHSWVLEM